MNQMPQARGDSRQGEDRRRRLLALGHAPDEVARRTRWIYEAALERSRNIDRGNFTVLSVRDLRLLFELYDAAFFEGVLGAMLRTDDAELTFRLSRRMTRVAGTTSFLSARRPPPKESRRVDQYQITISTVLLFGTFHAVERPVMVSGLVCRDRLEALQRTFEHELLHLAEFLAWGESSCARANFHRLSQQIFGHAGVQHDLVTPHETAAATFDVRPGDRVSFEHEGVRRVGRVNRITRRATVLVENPGGQPYSDGKRYETFYVPLGALRREGEAGAEPRRR